MGAKGNLINWNTATWHIDEGMEWIEKSTEEICLVPEPKDIIFPELRTNEDSHLLCKKLRGKMTVTDSQAKQDALIKEFKRARPNDFKDIGKMCRVYLEQTCFQFPNIVTFCS